MMNPEFAKALAAFQAECPIIAKQSQAEVQGVSKKGSTYTYTYQYADLASVMEVIQPLLTKHGLFYVCTTGYLEGRFCMTGTIWHIESSEVITAVMPLADGQKPQDIGSAMTYYRRYMLYNLLNIVADQDDDGQRAQKAPSKPDRQSTDPNWQGDKKKKELENSARDLVRQLEAVGCREDIQVLLDSYAQVIEDVKHNLPSWWEGQHRHDQFILGLAQHIDNAYARVNDIEQGAGVVQ